MGQILEGIGGAAKSAWARITDEIQSREAVNDALLKLGWPPTDLVDSEVNDRIRVALEGDAENLRERVEATLMDSLDADYWQEKLTDWARNQAISDRKNILEQAVRAFSQDMYAAPAPMLYPQIEAMVVKAFNHHGNLDGKKLDEYLNVFTSSRIPLKGDQVAKVALHRARANARWGKPVRSDISRHAILHGLDATYGTKIKALKVLMLFDYIQRGVAHGFVIVGSTAHQACCPKIDANNNDLAYCRNPFYLMMERGRRAQQQCGHCRAFAMAFGPNDSVQDSLPRTSI